VKSAYITVLPATPVTAFIAYPTAGPVPLAVSFADISTNSPTSWSWVFGDGGTATAQNPSHTYTAVGCYTVSLTVENAGGSDIATRDDYIVVSFPDVPKGYWAFDAIMACWEAGITLGYGDGLFHPEIVVNRAQMATFIARAMAGGDSNVPTGPGTATFPDVPTSYWAYDYIEYAYDQGVVLGYWDGYHPEEDVDRGQMAVFIARAMCGGDDNVPADDGTPTFPDVTVDGSWSWAYHHVEYIAGESVTNGYPDGNYHPEFTVSRDQMAVFVQRAFDLPIPGT
jgi:PKD repeat protein